MEMFLKPIGKISLGRSTERQIDKIKKNLIERDGKTVVQDKYRWK